MAGKRRIPRSFGEAAAPDIDPGSCGSALKQVVSTSVLDPPEAADESRSELRLEGAEPLQDPRIESEPEILARESQPTKRLHKVRKGGEDQVERTKLPLRGRLTGYLSYDETSPTQAAQELGVKHAEVLQIENVGPEVLHLRSDDVLD
jgi:hypothetical protein